MCENRGACVPIFSFLAFVHVNAQTQFANNTNHATPSRHTHTPPSRQQQEVLCCLPRRLLASQERPRFIARPHCCMRLVLVILVASLVSTATAFRIDSMISKFIGKHLPDYTYSVPGKKLLEPPSFPSIRTALHRPPPRTHAFLTTLA
jgi:hypothetical protein